MIRNEKNKTFYIPQEPIMIVQILHGMSEHRGRYEQFAKNLMNLGAVVVVSDHLGHGGNVEDETEYGYFAKEGGWKRLVENQHEITMQIKKEFPDLPFVLFGHSMGSLIARSYAKRYDYELSALILCGAPNYNPGAPAARSLALSIAKIKGDHYRSSLLDRLTFGAFNKSIENPRTDFDWLSKSGENVDCYLNDPQCGFIFTAKGFADLFEGVIDMHDVKGWMCSNPNLPILITAGEKDPCTGGNKGLLSTSNTLKKAGYSNIQIKTFETLRHEILNENEQDFVFETINQWILTHLGK